MGSSGGEAGSKIHTYGFWVAVSFTINYVVGVGVLEIPNAFAKAGVIFGTVVLFVSGFFVLVGLTWIVETSGRAMGWTAVVLAEKLHERNQQLLDPSHPTHLDDIPDGISMAQQHPHDLEDDDQLPTIGRSVRRLSESIIDDPLLEGHVTMPHFVKEQLARPADEIERMLESYASHIVHTAPNPAGVLSPLSTQYQRTPASPHEDINAPLLSSGTYGQHQVSFDLEDPRVKIAFAASRHKLFELNELLDIFGPTWAKIAYELALAMLLFLALWAYASVFGNSMVSKFPILHWSGTCDSDDHLWSTSCGWAFRIFVLIYGCVVVTLTCMEFTEMMAFQVTMTIARFLLIAFVFFTCLIGIFTDPHDNCPSGHPDCNAHHSAPYTGNYPLWEWSGVVTILSATVFSQLAGFGAPAILSPLKDKKKSLIALGTASLCTSILYLSVGLVATIYYGDTVKSAINLNYRSYTGGSASAPWWAKIVQYFIVLFPAMDVLSVFPLLGVALGNSLRALVVKYSSRARDLDHKGSTVKIICRLCAAVPPLFGSLIERDLSAILTYTCIPSLWLAFLGPMTLQYFSVKKCKDLGVDHRTPYTVRYISDRTGMVITFIFAIACYILMIGNLINSKFPAV